MIDFKFVVDAPTLTMILGFGAIFALVFIQGQRIDAVNGRIDEVIRDNQGLHKEIMELIKKMK